MQYVITVSEDLSGATYSIRDQTYTIVNNDSNDCNDIVLTVVGVSAGAPNSNAQAVTVPRTPNTGFGLTLANPLQLFLLTSGAALILLGIAYTLNPSTFKRRH